MMCRNITIVTVLLTSIATLLLGTCAPTPPSHPVTTVLLVRHAEKSRCSPPGPDCDPNDPPLTARGLARADELARVAAKAGVEAIYSTDTQRTRSTVQPLADSLGLQTILYGTPTELASAVQSAHSGETVLVAGHSNTLPLIVDELGGEGAMCPIGSEYDKLCIVTIHENGAVNVVHLQYGEPSLPDSGEGQTTTARIRSAAPNGSVLATATTLVPAPQSTGARPLATFIFSPTIELNLNETYLIEWLAPGDALLTWMAADGTPYPGGTAFGCTGIAIPNEDYLFTTYREATPAGPDQVSHAQTGTSRGCGTTPHGTLFQSFTPSASPLAAVDLRLRVGGQFPGGLTHEMTTVVLARNVQPGSAAEERALALAHTAFKAGVMAIYASPPQDVVLRLADVRGLKVQDFGPDDVEVFVSRLLSKHAGEVVVVVGAPDTITDIIRKLGGGPVPSVAPDEYDDLFLVTVYEPGAAKVLGLQYGPAH